MRHSKDVPSEFITTEPVFPSDVERDALSAHLTLAQRLACMDPKGLADMPSHILLKADTALANADDWLSAWQQIVYFATQRIRINLPDNVLVLDRPRPPKS